jgi:adenylate kinase
MPLMLMIAGPPGSGKGTLCDNIVAERDVVHISGGDILRAEIKKKTPVGLEALKYMARGALVPDNVIIKMILGRLREPDVVARGALLDGFPRTGAQAEALKRAGVTFDAMVVLDVPVPALMERSAGRRLDPVTGTIYHLKYKKPPANVVSRLVIRPDDTVAKQTARIAIYDSMKAELLAAYGPIVMVVNANQPIKAVFAEFQVLLANFARRNSKL